ncbi:MAG TPA: prepilin-type N-terminal cleavage/methylation domain-containing protein [Candidatus Binatus sp.]|jgi:type IV pilus assembly protein PilA|nr:prepilin-type N-terminal cleavage/methylation domain-containing protein [Candidatus Binatus sp.]
MMRSTKGFSLIELLIVVAIILIIAAIAIPNLLQARLAANEASAVGSLSAIKSAEVTYTTAYPTVGYSPDIGSLGGASPCTPSSSTACLVDSFLSSSTPGSGGKSGYVYLATGIMPGGSLTNAAFVAAAAPVFAHSTGNHDYCSTNDGVLRSQLASPGDLPVNNLASCIAFAVTQ